MAVDGWLAVAEAAAALGVSTSRVHQLVADGALAARRAGSQILVDQAGVQRRVEHRPAAGRPLGPQLAWAALAALSADGSVDVRAHADRNLRHRLNALLRSSPDPDRWGMLLRARARPQRCWAHPAMVGALLGVVPAAAAAASTASESDFCQTARTLTDMDVRVGQRAQVVIPAALRRKMGVQDGDLLHAEVDERGRLVLEKVDPDPVQRLLAAGSGLYDGRDAVEQQRDLREEWAGREPA